MVSSRIVSFVFKNATAHAGAVIGCREGVPLGGPVHQVVTGNQRRKPEEDLGLSTAEGVEDGIVSSAGPGVLTVGRKAEVDDTLLLGTTCEECRSAILVLIRH